MGKIDYIHVILFLLLGLISKFANAQLSAADKDNYSEGDYYFSVGDFNKAVKYFDGLAVKYPDNSKFNYRAATCYMAIKGSEKKALPFLRNAVKEIDTKYSETKIKGTGAPVEAWLYLGDALHAENIFLEASQAYHNYKQHLSPGSTEMKRATTRIRGLGLAYEESLRPSGYELTNIGDVINTINSDYSPVFSGDMRTMAYTSFLDPKDKVFFSEMVNGVWSKPTDITAQTGSGGDCFTAALSFDGNELYLINYDPFDSDIFVSKKSKGKWTKMEAVDKKRINSKYIENGVSVSADGNTMFFSSNRPGGYGGFDIYISQKQGETWLKPVNLGKTINTPDNEENPVLSPDGNKLFFASNGHSTIGGMDIFWSVKDSNGEWQDPINMGAAVNTPGDDISFWFYDETQPGFVSRADKNSFGKTDIYKVVYTAPPQPVFEDVYTALPGTSGIFATGDTVVDLLNDTLLVAFHSPSEKILGEGKGNETKINISETEIVQGEENKVVQITETEKDLTEQPKPNVINIKTGSQGKPGELSVKDGQYTIQIMALLRPREAAIFERIDKSKMRVTQGNDGFYRYTYGMYSSQAMAVSDLRKLIRLGFKDAFIRNIDEIDNY
ncbi:MAG: PD40 domain-containing protein [Bacteroidales bacterium]|nr:PD40 domain-containing protein [Bacteroidales bacterium]